MDHVYLFDGRNEHLVFLSGAGSVVGSYRHAHDLRFAGWDVDFTRPPTTALPLSSWDAVIDVGVGQTTTLDTHAFDASSQGFNCSGDVLVGSVVYKTGFVVCYNDVAPKVVPPGGSFGRTIAPPRGDGDYTNDATSADGADPIGPQRLLLAGLVGGKLFPTLPTTNDSDDFKAVYRDSGNAAAVHYAEPQIFYSIGRLQRYFNLLGYPAVGDSQDPRRMEITVHWKGDSDFGSVTNNAEAAMGYLHVGDFRTEYGRPIDGVAEGRIVLHEYQHHALDAAWSLDGAHKKDPLCAGSLCEELYLHEGLSDAHAVMYFNEPRSSRLNDMDGLYDSCANPSAYPDNPLGSLNRSACNSIVYDYWKTAPDVTPSGVVIPTGEPHRRGGIILGAAWQFHRRLVDGGLAQTLAPGWIFQASRRVASDHDDERVLASHLVEVLRSQSGIQKRFWKTALMKLEEKGVFLKPSTGEPDRFSCDVASCTPSQARGVSIRTLGIEGALTWDGASPTPSFNVFVPLGTSYRSEGVFENTVEVQFSTDAAFTSVVASENYVASAFLSLNKSPRGFGRYVPSPTTWNAAVAAARATQDRQLFYRVRQCLSTDPTSCVVTSSGGLDAQFIRIAPSPPSTGCAVASPGYADGDALFKVYLVAAGVLALRLRSRKRGS